MAIGKTVIVTGGSQGIGAAIVQVFLKRSYNVVATSRSISNAGYPPSPNLALVDGDISRAETAEEVAKTAIKMFGSIDHVVNNAGKVDRGMYEHREIDMLDPREHCNVGTGACNRTRHKFRDKGQSNGTAGLLSHSHG